MAHSKRKQQAERKEAERMDQQAIEVGIRGKKPSGKVRKPNKKGKRPTYVGF